MTEAPSESSLPQTYLDYLASEGFQDAVVADSGKEGTTLIRFSFEGFGYGVLLDKNRPNLIALGCNEPNTVDRAQCLEVLNDVMSTVAGGAMLYRVSPE